MRADPTPSTVADLARLLPDRVEWHYGPDARVEELRGRCQRFAGDRRRAEGKALRAFEAAAQQVFRHIELERRTGLTAQQMSPGWPDPDIAAIRRTGADIATVERRADGTALIAFTGMADATAAAPLLAAAFRLVADADRLILDLRANGGGDPATVVAIVDWLVAGPPRHLFDVRYRDRVRQWWSPATPLAEPPRGEVTALIGPGTYSSGELLAWLLQRERLATLSGAPTPGAADHVVPLALTHDIRGVIPEAATLAPDGAPTWEGVGVAPTPALLNTPPSA